MNNSDDLDLRCLVSIRIFVIHSEPWNYIISGMLSLFYLKDSTKSAQPSLEMGNRFAESIYDCDSLLFNIRLLCNVIFSSVSGQGGVKGLREFENFNLIMILKTEPKQLLFLGESSRPCVLLSQYLWRAGTSMNIGGERDLGDKSHLPEDRFLALGIRKWKSRVLDTFLILSGTEFLKLASGCKGLPFLWVISCSPCKLLPLDII